MISRTTISLLLATAALAVAPALAAAGTMRSYGTYDGDPGVNTVTASFDGTSVTLSDSAGITLGRGDLSGPG